MLVVGADGAHSKTAEILGFNLVRFCDLLEEEIRALLLYRSLKDPEKVMRVEDFHKSLQTVPLNALLYLEKVVNTIRC